MTDFTSPPNESPEAFGAALATVAATEAYVNGLTPAELHEIGRCAAEAIRDAEREHWQGGMSEENARKWFRAAVRSFVEALRSSSRR